MSVCRHDLTSHNFFGIRGEINKCLHYTPISFFPSQYSRQKYHLISHWWWLIDHPYASRCIRVASVGRVYRLNMPLLWGSFHFLWISELKTSKRKLDKHHLNWQAVTTHPDHHQSQHPLAQPLQHNSTKSSAASSATFIKATQRWFLQRQSSALEAETLPMLGDLILYLATPPDCISLQKKQVWYTLAITLKLSLY